MGNESLTQEQIAFCAAYVSPEHLRSSAKEAAAIAYGYDLEDRLGKQNVYNTGNRNLKHPQIDLLITILLDSAGFNNEYVDKRLMELIEQRADPKTSVLLGIPSIRIFKIHKQLFLFLILLKGVSMSRNQGIPSTEYTTVTFIFGILVWKLLAK